MYTAKLKQTSNPPPKPWLKQVKSCMQELV